MSLKIIGVIFVVVGCAGFGFLVAGSARYHTCLLQQLLRVLNTMECELQYRMPTLPDLGRISAEACSGRLRSAFLDFSDSLDTCTEVNVSQCMLKAVGKTPFPKEIERLLLILGDSLGRFELEGQLRGIAFVRKTCEHMLNNSMSNQSVRLRSYQTLAVCAGAALAILLV